MHVRKEEEEAQQEYQITRSCLYWSLSQSLVETNNLRS